MPVKVGITLIAAYLGYYVPRLYIKNKVTKRQQSIRRAWPDALPAAAVAGTLGQPLLYVGASSVPPSVAGYLDASSGSLNAVLVLGRPTVPAPGVLTAAGRLAGGRIPR